MSDIKINDIFGLSLEEINNSKLELNMWAGSGGEEHIDRWLYSCEIDKRSGTCKNISYYGWYGNKRNFREGQWVFSFVRIREDEWLFISAAEIINIPKHEHANVKILHKYKPYFGRLIIHLSKGNTFARYTFNFSTFTDSIKVKTILPTLYGDEGFPGYDKVRLSFKRLEAIIRDGSTDWIAALEHQKGVYLITDKSNGKMYVGSATSNEGMLLQRWGDYIKNGHGGNIELIELVNNKGIDYIKTNFFYSILENYNAKVDDSIILDRESWWKTNLQTRAYGYNRN